jgi:FeS assembly SUF system regulator
MGTGTVLFMFSVSRMSDYAVVVLAELARARGHARSATQAALDAGLPQPTVRKVLKGLARAGLVSSERGALGGYRLGRDPRAIRLEEIIEAFEGPVAVTACNGSPPECDRSDSCGARRCWAPVNAALRHSLARYTLADMLRPDSSRSARALRPSGTARGARTDRRPTANAANVAALRTDRRPAGNTAAVRNELHPTANAAALRTDRRPPANAANAVALSRLPR